MRAYLLLDRAMAAGARARMSEESDHPMIAAQGSTPESRRLKRAAGAAEIVANEGAKFDREASGFREPWSTKRQRAANERRIWKASVKLERAIQMFAGGRMGDV